ncbi:threonine aldolase family protein [Sphingosinicella rhizophila]|uniref:Beta-eliminating lyase-related protein n=1 Tax=Sphingosinicella rhizophila TaxID=3050082 RepID=A0ABU3Q7P0_9SPHN|nr:beta-eliminating lyase-related protein [Sphingosinicella sp. GR2756]MDT9599312.1 beta-eliminating lyase-related protein [Sphingosinicella sp. GR2756]
MRFFSDNAAAVCPEVMSALAAANRPDIPYDGDAWSARLDTAFSQLFETEVRAIWVTTGTAANALALAELCPPYGGIVCHRDAHIQLDECGAPEFYTHGAKLLLADGEGAKLSPAGVAAVLDAIGSEVHRVRPAALSITNGTEYGLVYTPAEVAALGNLCRARGLGFHLDGARFANAVAALGCSPADLSWRAGVDALSFGFTKNGGLCTEVLILFGGRDIEPSLFRRKRGGHLLSKGRYLATQLLAMLEDDLWLRNARTANRHAARIAAAAGDWLAYPVEINEVFLKIGSDQVRTLRDKGFDFYDWVPGEVRLVTAWDSDPAAIEALAVALEEL